MLTVVFIIELIVEISLPVLAFTAQDYITNCLKNVMNPWITEYKPDPLAKVVIDSLQTAVSFWSGVEKYFQSHI